MKALGDFVFGALTLVYPRAFRAQYGDDLIAFFRADRARPRDPAGMRGWLQFWMRTTRDALRTASSLRAESHTTTRPSLAAAAIAPLRHLRADLRSARRSLLGTPATTFVALLVLTIGLGASTTIFAVVDAIALRPLPFADPATLVSVAEVDLKTGRPSTVAAQNYLDWIERQDVFSEIGASNYVFLTLTQADQSERLRSVRITASLFPMLGAAPQLGRLFTTADEQPGSDGVVLVSDGFWRSRLGGRADAVGLSVQFEDRARRIVGVMPPGFVYPIVASSLSDVSFWVPMAFTARDRQRAGVGRTYALSVVARLKPGVMVERARQRIVQIRDALAPQYRLWFNDHGATVRPLRDAVVSAAVRSWTQLLLGAVAIVLLIACVNVANLLLARASGRAREFSIRAALGATRADLIRGVAVESLLLAAAGVVGGWLVAQAGVGLLRSTLPDMPRLSAIALDGRVFAIAAVSGALTALLVGIAPAFALTRPRVSMALRESGRANTAGRAQQRLRSALVVIEVALAIVLLVGTGAFAASFLRVVNRDLGFDPDRVATFSVSPRRGADALGRSPEATDAEDRITLAAVLARVSATPGVETVAFMNGGLPLSGSSRSNSVTVAWRAEPFTGADEAYICETTAGYFDVIGLRLRRGRWLSDADRAGSPNVIVLSETAVARYLGDREPLGAEVTIDEKPWTVVGVVGDTLFRGPEAERLPQVYMSVPQSTSLGTNLAVRLRSNDAALVDAVKQAIWTAAPSAIVSNVRTLNDLFATLLAQRRFNMLLIGAFGLIALLLVFAGIYGVMAYIVAQRVTEIGVRMALGARPSQMLGMVLVRAMRLAAVGLALGWIAAAGLEQFIRAFLFKPEPRDPVVYVGVALALLLTTMIAALVPARRAARVDPLVSLRAN